MKVRELMTTQVETCPGHSDLAAAAMIMWRRNCGAVPVTDGRSPRVVGVITDHDICMAAATRHCAPDQIRVRAVVNGLLHFVTPDDEIETALERLASARASRLPVLGAKGEAVGMLFLNDILLRAGPVRGLADEALRTMRTA
jgi:CBS domain-containing protein